MMIVYSHCHTRLLRSVTFIDEDVLSFRTYAGLNTNRCGQEMLSLSKYVKAPVVVLIVSGTACHIWLKKKKNLK